MPKKTLSIIFLILTFLFTSILFIPKDKQFFVDDVISPLNFVLNNKNYTIKDLQTFDSYYSDNNSKLAKDLNISENEAFILGNLGKYWTINLMKGRKVYIKENDLIFFKNSYRTKFLHSGYCIVDSKPYSKLAFDKRLKEIRKAQYKILNLNDNKFYEIKLENAKDINNFILIRKSHIPKISNPHSKKYVNKDENIKVFFTDSTSKVRPDRTCSTYICREILTNIKSARKTIDMAIYGYSKVPVIEEALRKAVKRGVKIRLVYDSDAKGNNIYQDTKDLLSIISKNKSDKYSSEAQNIMHNKFYIFDDETLITGSANLSHTDMSGFNSNSIISLKSKDVAKVYKKEFEQMFNGKFHNDKAKQEQKTINISETEVEIYFSPQDKSLTNAIIPLIKKAEKYIYIPTFVLTERRVTEELIKAKLRGVDVKIIIDALNASIRHSKHNELRQGKLLVKTENYAGKMHSKSIIIDDKYTIIGSMNFSNSGENKNDENLIVINNPEIAKLYKEFFLYQWNQIDDKWLYKNVRAESWDSIGSCYDGLDNNYDGLVDLEDKSCKTHPNPLL